MRATEELSRFVHDGLQAGRSPDDLREAMQAAGWAAPEIDSALAGWLLSGQAGIPPVPRPRAYVSALEALLYGLLFIALGMISWHIVALGSEIINALIPDFGDYTRSYSSPRWSIASLIVFVPVFLILNRRVNQRSRQERSLVRRWFASLTLLIAVIVLLSDLAYTIYALLGGELTARFAAKAALVALVGGLVVAYYRDEMDG